jgi:hypothetical protein
MLWAPSLPPVSRNQSLSRLLLSLFLIEVRAITETGDLKDRLQEVPEGDNWPRRHFFPGNICLHLRDISALGQYKKRLKNPISNLTPWDHRFLGPPVCPHVAFLFSSLQIKSFWPLLLESACAFILRVDPRTLKTWKFLCVSSVHQYLWELSTSFIVFMD